MIVILVGAAVAVCFIEIGGNDVKNEALDAINAAAEQANREAERLQKECLDCQLDHPDDPTACAAICKMSEEQRQRADEARREAAAAAIKVAEGAGTGGVAKSIISGLKPVLYAAVGAYAVIAIFKVINDKKE
jgi:hypothetical protein